MLKQIIFAFLFFVSLFRDADCFLNESVFLTIPIEKEDNLGTNILFYTSAIAFIAVVRYLTKNYGLYFPWAIFAIFFGISWGIAILYIPWMSQVILSPTQACGILMYVFLPQLIFVTAFCMDSHIFIKSLCQIWIVALCGILSACGTGFLMRLVINPGWQNLTTLFFGFIFFPIYPLNVFHWLNGSSLQSKYVSILIRGEVLISCTITFGLSIKLLGYMNGWMVHWYQGVLDVLRCIVFASTIIIGMVFGYASSGNEYCKKVTFLITNFLSPMSWFYMPTMIFTAGFLIDAHTFLKSLPQTLILAGPVSILSALTSGHIMNLVIDGNWTNEDVLIFSYISSSIYPKSVINALHEHDIFTKRVIILLEGESLISAVLSYKEYVLIRNYMGGWTVWGYQFVFEIVRVMVIGFPLSYLYGCLGSTLMKQSYNDAVSLMILTISMCYTTFFLMRWICNTPLIGTAVVGIMMGLERSSLSKDAEKKVIDLWKTISCIINITLFINIGLATPNLIRNVQFSDLVLVFVTYLITNITRFTSFFLFSPILSRVGYGMSFKNMILCVWGGLKNPICLNMALDLDNQIYHDEPQKLSIIFLHTVAVYLLMLFINGSCVPILMKALGLSEISVSRQVNMNNCMRYINEARTKTVAILKMDRFLSDANWPLVMSATTLKHPYKSNLRFEDADAEEESEYFLGYKFTFCPDCQKNVLNEPTPKELKEMIKEAKLRVLKLKKTSYTRQYENGMMSKEAIRILLQAVEIAMDSEELTIELDGMFTLFSKEGIFYRFLRNRLQYFLKNTEKKYKEPRKRLRAICYRIVNHVVFTSVINIVLVTHIFIIITHYVLLHKYGSTMMESHLYGTFFCIYFVEFWLKILAFSWIYICADGFRNYFRSNWRILEFINGLINLSTILLCEIFEMDGNVILLIFDIILLLLLFIRSCRIYLNLLRKCSCGTTLIDYLIKFFNTKVDRHRALAYELGKNYIAGEIEILENLNQIVDSEKIRETVREQIERDRSAVMRKLGHAQKESPGVVITVKTKMAMRTVLNSMKDEVQELKVAGWVDDVEYNKLLNSLNERYRYINNIKAIESSSPKMVLREIPYIEGDEELIEFLYSNVITKKYDPGAVVLKEGELLGGIYVLIAGMFEVTYTPRKDVLEKLKKYGILPIVTYSVTYEESTLEVIIPGNTIGELGLLVGRPYNGTIIAQTHSQMYIIPENIIKEAFTRDDDPVTGLECRMWKHVAFRRAVPLLMTVSSYRSYTQEKIKLILERSFVPNLTNYKVFIVNDMMEDIILTEGIVVDFNTKEVYIAPSYIPRAVQKLVLPKSSLMSLEVMVEPRLLIIPAKEYNEYEIMVMEEETCQLVHQNLNRCLRHIVQQKAFNSKAKKQIKEIWGGGSDPMNLRTRNHRAINVISQKKSQRDHATR